MHAVENYQHAGVQVEIFYDPDALSPRDADNLGEMYVCYRGHNLGDHQLPSDGLPDIDCPVCQADDAAASEDLCERCEDWGQISPTLAEWLASINALAAMPLFVFDHSGISIRGGRLVMLDDDKVDPEDTHSAGRFVGDAQGWDTSFVGFMVVTERSISRLCGEGDEYRSKEWLDSALRSELQEYDRYLRGEVYYFRVGDGTPFEDSCGGFIGIKYAKEEASRAAEAVAAQQHDEEVERADWEARDVVTVFAS